MYTHIRAYKYELVHVYMKAFFGSSIFFFRKLFHSEPCKFYYETWATTV